MINIYQGLSNTFVLTLSETQTLTDPYFIFQWTDINDLVTTLSLTDLSSSPDDYNKFTFIDASDASLYYSGEVKVYESSYDASVIDASMGLLETNQYTYYPTSSSDYIYDPSISGEADVMYLAESAPDIIYQPFFGTGATPGSSVKFDHADLLKLDVHDHPIYTPDVSYGTTLYWDSGLLEASVGSDIATMAYIDGSLAERDASIANLDASIVRMDGSINALFAQDQNDVSKEYVDGSLNERDVSIAWLDGSLNALYDDSIDISTASPIYYTNDGDTMTLKFDSTNLDASLNGIRNDIVEIDASIVRIDGSINALYAVATGVTKAYVDASLAARDVSIAENETQITILDASVVRMDGSINALFAQDQNDVSKEYVDGSLGTRDTSITENINDIVNIESSLGTLDSLISDNADDITNVESSLGTLDNLISTNADNITNLESSVGDLDTYKYDKSGGTIDGDVAITGNFQVDGSVTYINTETVDVSDNIISINTGLTGTPPAGLQSGIKVNRGDEEPYIFIFDETNDTFRIGIAEDLGSGSFNDASTQAVATREDSPDDTAFAIWDAATFKFLTSTDFTTTTVALTSYVDGSLNARDVSIANLDASIIRIDGSINALYEVTADVTKAYVDGSLATRDSSITYNINVNVSQDASIELLDSSVASIYNDQLDLSTYDPIYYTNDGDTLKIGITDSVSKTYVDGSLNERDVSTAWLVDHHITKAYVDASLNERDVSIAWLAANSGDATLESIGDVSIVSVADTQVIAWDSGDSVWKNTAAGSGGSSSLITLTDVSVSTPTDTQVLAYDADTSVWKNLTSIDTSLYDIVDASDYFWVFSDVSITSPVQNQALVYDATNEVFKNATIDGSVYTTEAADTYFQLKPEEVAKASDADGSIGQMSVDASYLYVCTSTNVWGRLLLENDY